MTNKDVLFNMPTAKRVKTRQLPIVWTDEDKEGVLYPYEDALVIKASVPSKKFDWILVDSWSSVDVLLKSILDKMRITYLSPEYASTSLKGFGGGRLTPLGVAELPITIGSAPFENTMMLDFIIVDKDSPY